MSDRIDGVEVMNQAELDALSGVNYDRLKQHPTRSHQAAFFLGIGSMLLALGVNAAESIDETQPQLYRETSTSEVNATDFFEAIPGLAGELADNQNEAVLAAATLLISESCSLHGDDIFARRPVGSGGLYEANDQLLVGTVEHVVPLHAYECSYTADVPLDGAGDEPYVLTFSPDDFEKSYVRTADYLAHNDQPVFAELNDSDEAALRNAETEGAIVPLRVAPEASEHAVIVYHQSERAGPITIGDKVLVGSMNLTEEGHDDYVTYSMTRAGMNGEICPGMSGSPILSVGENGEILPISNGVMSHFFVFDLGRECGVSGGISGFQPVKAVANDG